MRICTAPQPPQISLKKSKINMEYGNVNCKYRFDLRRERLRPDLSLLALAAHPLFSLYYFPSSEPRAYCGKLVKNCTKTKSLLFAAPGRSVCRYAFFCMQKWNFIGTTFIVWANRISLRFHYYIVLIITHTQSILCIILANRSAFNIIKSVCFVRFLCRARRMQEKKKPSIQSLIGIHGRQWR